MKYGSSHDSGIYESPTPKKRESEEYSKSPMPSYYDSLVSLKVFHEHALDGHSDPIPRDPPKQLDPLNSCR